MITVEIKSKKNNRTDLEVRAMIKELPNNTEGLYDAVRIFNNRLPAFKYNHGSAQDFYSCGWKGIGKIAEIWHLNIVGDKDRLVAIITETEGKK